MRLALTAAGLMFFAAVAASAEEPASEPGEIVVHATRNPQEVRQFVQNVSIETPSASQIARWNQHLCPGVVGATPEASQAIIDQIARRAAAVGLRVEAPGCRPDLTIMVTADSDPSAGHVTTAAEQRLGTSSGPVCRSV